MKRMKMESIDVVLEKLQKSDYPLIEQLWTNEKVRQYLGGVVPKERLSKILDEMLENKKGIFFVIKDKKTKNYVGLISIDDYHDKINKELSYQILPEYWHMGIGFKSALMMLQYAKNELKLGKIYSETQSKNERSRILLEKIGMKKEKELARFGEQQIVYSILLQK